MLSSVLRSPRAVAVNVEIMRAFVRLRRLLAGNADLAQRLEELEARTEARFQKTDEQIRLVFDAIPRTHHADGVKAGADGISGDAAQKEFRGR